MEKRRNRPKDMFNSFSTLCNVLPYFGYLDQSYKMMAQLCRNSRLRWRDYEGEFCNSLLDDRKRKLALWFSYSSELLNWKLKDIIEFLDKYPIIYKIFQLPHLNVISASDLETLIRFCQRVDNKFLRFTTLNFDHIKLETDFHERYSDLLEGEGLQEQSERVHHYISSKGILIDANSLGEFSHVPTSVPKTSCWVMLTRDTLIDENFKLDDSLKQSIRDIKINYIKEINI